MAIVYEWDYETWDEDGDILEHDQEEHIADFSDERRTDHLVLVRNEGSEASGLTDRSWAYVVNGALPKYFSDSRGESTGVMVPMRYHKEIFTYLHITH
jgi:hypothetical protein